MKKVKITFAEGGKEAEIKSIVRDLVASGEDFAKLDAASLIVRKDSDKYKEMMGKTIILQIDGEEQFCQVIAK